MKTKWRRGIVPYRTNNWYPGRPGTEMRPGLISGNLGIIDACGWCLTHIPSGLQVGSFNRLRAARETGAVLRAEFGDLAFLDRAAAAQCNYPYEGSPGTGDDDWMQVRFRERLRELQRQLDCT